MRRLVLVLFATAALAHGQVFRGVKMAGVQVSTATSAPPSGITFSPVAGHYANAQSVTITSNPSSGVSLFYSLDGSLASEASTNFSTPIAMSQDLTVNAMAISTPDIMGQAIQQCGSGSCWSTQLSCNSTQCAPYVGSYNTPAIKYCSGSGAGCGVSGIPTDVNFLTGIANPSLTGQALHANFTTENIPGAGSQTQVLWPNKQAADDSATYQVENYYMLPGESYTGIWALESDLVLWVRSRNLILSAALQCYVNAGKWQYNGQAGSWNDFGKDQNNNPIVYYKNGVAQTAGATLTEGCSTTNGGTISGALTNTQTSFVTSAAVTPGSIIHVDNENILVTAASGTSVTSSVRGYQSAATTHSSGAAYLTWIHVQYHASFNPGVTDATCKDVSTGLATECVYIDYLAINSDVYTFGTTTTHNASGQTITVSILKVPAAALPSGYPSRCFNQLQIDTAGTGASPSNPITYGMYYDAMNMACGTGSPNATGSAAYTF